MPVYRANGFYLMRLPLGGGEWEWRLAEVKDGIVTILGITHSVMTTNDWFPHHFGPKIEPPGDANTYSGTDPMSTDASLTPEMAIERLAERLYETMEHLDPVSDEAIAWGSLNDRRRDFYCLCIEALLERRDLIRRVTP